MRRDPTTAVQQAASGALDRIPTDLTRPDREVPFHDASALELCFYGTFSMRQWFPIEQAVHISSHVSHSIAGINQSTCWTDESIVYGLSYCIAHAGGSQLPWNN